MAVHGCVRPRGLWAGPAWGRVVAPAVMAVAGRARQGTAHKVVIDPAVAGRGAGPVCAPVVVGAVALVAVDPAVLGVVNAPAQVSLIQAHQAVVGDPEGGRMAALPVGEAPKVRHAAECLA